MVTKAAGRDLVALGRDANIKDGWNFESWPVALKLPASAGTPAIAEVVHETESQLASCGYVVVSFRNALAGYDDSQTASAVTLFLTAIGKLTRVFRNLPSEWRHIDVDLSRPPNRSRGVGHQALHMDFVNASSPPHYVCLHCVRPDPMDGGQSLIANLDGLETELSGSALVQLNRPIYADGRVVDLDGIGTDINPFRVYSPGAEFRFRYTSHLLESTQDKAARRALGELDKRLQARVATVPLGAEDMLLFDQRRILHGRLPLGGVQESLSPEKRRLVVHSFVNERPLKR